MKTTKNIYLQPTMDCVVLNSANCMLPVSPGVTGKDEPQAIGAPVRRISVLGTVPTLK